MPFRWEKKWNILGDGVWREVTCVAQSFCPGCKNFWRATCWFGSHEPEKLIRFLQEHAAPGDPPALDMVEAEFPEAFENYLTWRLS